MKPWRLIAVALVLTTTACAAQPAVRSESSPAPTRTPTPTVTPTAKPTAEKPVAFDTFAPMTKNKLYTVGRIPRVSCSLPSARLTSKAAVQARAQQLVKCLDKAWAPLVAKTSSYVTSPAVIGYTRTKSVKVCGYPPVANSSAYYCSGQQAIHFEWKHYLENGDRVWAETRLLWAMIHEYGHHVQYSVGIGGLLDRRTDQETAPAQLESSRRLELQATCFGAAFVGANRAAVGLTGKRLRAWRFEYRQGDEAVPKNPRDHGSVKSNRYWTNEAFSSGDPGSCNTWAASAKRVS